MNQTGLKLVWVPAALCAACAPLATVSSQHGAVVTVQGAHGQLSPAQGHAVVSRAVTNAPDPDSAHALVVLTEELSGDPLYKDNKARLLVDGPATYDAMLAAIRAARRYVHIETYIFGDDEVGQTFAELLTERASEGVEVRLLYDSLGSREASSKFFDAMKAAGMEVIAFRPANPVAGGNPLKINNRDHRKILVVDGEVAFTGGVNIDRNYSSSSGGGSSNPESERGWRDTHIVVQGPAVEAFDRLFVANWLRAGGDSPAIPTPAVAPQIYGKDLVGVLSAVGGEGKVSPIRHAYQLAMEKAVARVWITQPYFTPDKAFLRTVTRAAKRGLDVRLILPASSDSTIVLLSSRHHYARLLRGGVRIFERPDTMMHAKTAVVDGIWSTVGSSNLDYRSFLHNDEINAVIVGEDFAKQLEQLFRDDLEACKEVTRTEWDKRPIVSRVGEFFANAIAYWL